jgi:iron complex outermembrane receptor protein
MTSFHQDTIQGHVNTNYQTNNGLFSISGTLTGNRNGFIWGGVETYKLAKNYQNRYDGRVYGTAFKETDFSGYFGVNKHWGYSHLKFSSFNDLQEIPDGNRDSTTRKFTKQITEDDLFRAVVTDAELNSYKITALHQHIQHYRVYSSSNFLIERSELGITIGYQQNIRREFSHPEYPDIAGLHLDLKTLTYDIKYSVPESRGLEIAFGVNGMYQLNTNKGTDFIIPDYSQFDIGPFFLITKKAKKLDLSAGIRYDTRIFRNPAMYTIIDQLTGFEIEVDPSSGTPVAELRFRSYNHAFSGVSASIGATYSLTKKLLIKSNIARGFRAPNVAEISADGVHRGSLIYQTGNTSFKPEYSVQEDLGINYRSDHVSGYLDIFNNNISNYIYNHKLLGSNGKDSVIIKGSQTFKYDQARAQLYGWEASLDVHPFDWLHFENSIAVIYARNKGYEKNQVTDSSRYLPFIPPLHTNSELQANIPVLTKHIRSFFAKFGVEYNARQNRVYLADNTETPTPAYLLYSTGMGADITDKNGKVLAGISILGNNVTDVAYQSHLSRLKYFEQYPGNTPGRSGIYNMGRNISFKLTFPLNFR